jgi:hypothetical protein
MNFIDEILKPNIEPSKVVEKVYVDLLGMLLIERTGESGSHFSDEHRKGFRSAKNMVIGFVVDTIFNIFGKEKADCIIASFGNELKVSK